MLKPWCLFEYLKAIQMWSSWAVLVWDVLFKHFCLRHIPFFPGCVVTLYSHLMLTGLEESTDMINSIYHTVAVDSLTHHLSLLHEHHAAKSLVQKKKMLQKVFS